MGGKSGGREGGERVAKKAFAAETRQTDRWTDNGDTSGCLCARCVCLIKAKRKKRVSK